MSDQEQQVDAKGWPYLKRRDGTFFIVAGWALGFVGAVSLIYAWWPPTLDELGNVVPSAAVWQARFPAIGNLAMIAWVGFLACGHIIRALYFVTGIETKPRQSDAA